MRKRGVSHDNEVISSMAKRAKDDTWATDDELVFPHQWVMSPGGATWEFAEALCIDWASTEEQAQKDAWSEEENLAIAKVGGVMVCLSSDVVATLCSSTLCFQPYYGLSLS